MYFMEEEMEVKSGQILCPRSPRAKTGVKPDSKANTSPPFSLPFDFAFSRALFLSYLNFYSLRMSDLP